MSQGDRGGPVGALSLSVCWVSLDCVQEIVPKPGHLAHLLNPVEILRNPQDPTSAEGLLDARGVLLDGLRNVEPGELIIHHFALRPDRKV